MNADWHYHMPSRNETYHEIMVLFIPRHTKSGGVLCYTLQTLSVRRPSIHLSVCQRFISML